MTGEDNDTPVAEGQDASDDEDNARRQQLVSPRIANPIRPCSAALLVLERRFDTQYDDPESSHLDFDQLDTDSRNLIESYRPGQCTCMYPTH